MALHGSGGDDHTYPAVDMGALEDHVRDPRYLVADLSDWGRVEVGLGSGTHGGIHEGIPCPVGDDRQFRVAVVMPVVAKDGLLVMKHVKPGPEGQEKNYEQHSN
jgi:hypothetical protein